MNRADRTDSLWTRVRSAIGLGEAAREPAYGQPAIARRSNRKPTIEQSLDAELQRAWTHAGARNVSLCVLAFEIDGGAAYVAAYGQAAMDEAVETLASAIDASLPGEAHCLQVGQGRLMAVLPDLPMLMGRNLAGKLAQTVRRAGLPNKESHAGIVTLGMGLAVVNPQGEMDRDVIEAARDALQRSLRRGIARLEVIDLRRLQEGAARAA